VDSTTRTVKTRSRSLTRGLRGALALGAATALLLSGCASATPEQEPGGEELTTIIVGIVPLQSWTLPQIVASEEGFFQAHGLNVALQPIVGAPITPMAAGAVQISTTTVSPLLAAAAQEQELTIVNTLVPRFPFRLLAPEGSALLENGDDYEAIMEDLRGKTIGVTVLGGGVDLITRYLLTQYGLDPDTDVNIVPTGAPGTPQISALKTGQVDAVVVGDISYEVIANDEVGAELLIDYASAQLPEGMQQPGLVTAAMQSYAAENPEIIEAYIAALDDTNEWMSDPENFKRVDEIAREYLEALDPEIVTASMHYFIDNGLTGAYTCDDLDKGIDVAVATGLAPAGYAFPCDKFAMFAAE